MNVIFSHMKIHTDGISYKCNQCEKDFLQATYLAHHMTTHSGEKPYTFNLCDKAFTWSDSLKQHIKTHTGEKPYTCNQCGKAFAQSESYHSTRGHTLARTHMNVINVSNIMQRKLIYQSI